MKETKETPPSYTSLFTWESLIRSNDDEPTADQQSNFHKALQASLPIVKGFVKKHGRNFDPDLMISYAEENYPGLKRRNQNK